MIVVSDMTPLHYLILIGCDQILPRLYERVFTAPAVMKEMDDSNTPQAVRQWATSPPDWLHVQEPAQIEDIPRLGHGRRGAGEKAAIALGVCPSIAFRKRGSNNRVACGTRSPDLARLSDE
jgi:predicted nucleic acid-binding protein